MPAPPLESEPAMVSAIARHAAPRCASARSTMPRSSCAAAFGSGASDRAEITATPSAPAAITSAALEPSIPAIAAIGHSRRALAHDCGDLAQAGHTDRRIGIVLRPRGEHAADRNIVEMLERRGVGLRYGLETSPMIALRAEQQPRIAGRHVVPADMNAVGLGGERDIDAIVDEQRHVRSQAPP